MKRRGHGGSFSRIVDFYPLPSSSAVEERRRGEQRPSLFPGKGCENADRQWTHRMRGFIEGQDRIAIFVKCSCLHFSITCVCKLCSNTSVQF